MGTIMDCSDTVPALYETVILTLSDGDDYDISGGSATVTMKDVPDLIDIESDKRTDLTIRTACRRRTGSRMT